MSQLLLLLPGLAHAQGFEGTALLLLEARDGLLPGLQLVPALRRRW